MEDYKKEFIDFMIECEVLKFGDFVTKSGRKTPFFVNTGFYRTGSQLGRLGKYYAKAIRGAFGDEFDILFGPAYKGIPLSVATSMALSEESVDVKYCSNRKEVKDHGDTGILLGSPIKDGDKIVTSNISKKFLPGILIGYASEVALDSNMLTKSGYLIPVASFDTLQEVLIITELKEDYTGSNDADKSLNDN